MEKTVRVVVGATPGGFYDRWAQLLARYIPGNPNFIVQNMPGAGEELQTQIKETLNQPREVVDLVKKVFAD